MEYNYLNDIQKWIRPSYNLNNMNDMNNLNKMKNMNNRNKLIINEIEQLNNIIKQVPFLKIIKELQIGYLSRNNFHRFLYREKESKLFMEKNEIYIIPQELSTIQHLTSLTFTFCKIHDIIAIEIGNVLLELSSLTFLCFSYNNIQNHGAIMIGKSLSK